MITSCLTICASDIWRIGSQQTIEWNPMLPVYQNTTQVDILVYAQDLHVIKNISNIPLSQSSLTIMVDNTWTDSMQDHESLLSVVPHTQIDVSSATTRFTIVPSTLLQKRDPLEPSEVRIIVIVVVIFGTIFVILFVLLLRKKCRRSDKKKPNRFEGIAALEAFDLSPPSYNANTSNNHHHHHHHDSRHDYSGYNHGHGGFFGFGHSGGHHGHSGHHGGGGHYSGGDGWGGGGGDSGGGGGGGDGGGGGGGGDGGGGGGGC